MPAEMTAAVIAASPGPLGGIRSLQMAQALLLKLGCHIVPGQCHLPEAHKAFDPAGKLADDRARKALQALAAALVKTVSKLKG